MEAALDIRLNIPKSDFRFFKELAMKMGWKTETKKNALRQFIASRPKDVDVSDNEILSEVYAVRYGK